MTEYIRRAWHDIYCTDKAHISKQLPDLHALSLLLLFPLASVTMERFAGVFAIQVRLTSVVTPLLMQLVRQSPISPLQYSMRRLWKMHLPISFAVCRDTTHAGKRDEEPGRCNLLRTFEPKQSLPLSANTMKPALSCAKHNKFLG